MLVRGHLDCATWRLPRTVRSNGQRLRFPVAGLDCLGLPSHRDIPALRLVAHPSRDIYRRDQDRHVMIRTGWRRHSSVALLLRGPSTSDEHARCRAVPDNRPVDQSPSRDVGSAYLPAPAAIGRSEACAPRPRSWSCECRGRSRYGFETTAPRRCSSGT